MTERVKFGFSFLTNSHAARSWGELVNKCTDLAFFSSNIGKTYGECLTGSIGVCGAIVCLFFGDGTPVRLD